MMNLDPILSEMLDATTKGYPLSSRALPISAIAAQRWSVLAGDLPLPLAVIRDSALAHNHAWMRDFTASTGVLLAPHGKTTMAPQIFAQQLAAGAWGMTVANVQQLGICARVGVRRVLMANQLLGTLEVRTVIGLLRRHPDLEFHFLVDSLEQLAAIEADRVEHLVHFLAPRLLVADAPDLEALGDEVTDLAARVQRRDRVLEDHLHPGPHPT